MTVSTTTEEFAIDRGFAVGLDETTRGDATFVAQPDQTLDLARLLPFGVGFAPGTRLNLEQPEERYFPFLKLSLIDPVGPTFWAVEPWRLFDDYVIEIPEADVELLQLRDAREVAVLVLISLRGEAPTANVFAPIVINRRTRRAAQVILEDSGYSCAAAIDARTSRSSGGLA
jgi:flagellar assembly factor FliW